MRNEEISALEQRLVGKRIIPVAVMDSTGDAAPLARTLADAGIPIIEVTLRTACALDCIRAIRRDCPDVLVGAGTILDAEQVRAAFEAGAHFGVSPGLDEEIIVEARRKQWFFLPGVMTPSEAQRALRLGCRLQKFFPASTAGGVKMLSSLSAAFGHAGVRFVPLGGINAANVAEYLAVPGVAAVGGSWLCEQAAVREQRWGEIAALARAAEKAMPSR